MDEAVEVMEQVKEEVDLQPLRATTTRVKICTRTVGVLLMAIKAASMRLGGVTRVIRKVTSASTASSLPTPPAKEAVRMLVKGVLEKMPLSPI